MSAVSLSLRHSRPKGLPFSAGKGVSCPKAAKWSSETITISITIGCGKRFRTWSKVSPSTRLGTPRRPRTSALHGHRSPPSSCFCSACHLKPHLAPEEPKPGWCASPVEPPGKCSSRFRSHVLIAHGTRPWSRVCSNNTTTMTMMIY